MERLGMLVPFSPNSENLMKTNSVLEINPRPIATKSFALRSQVLLLWLPMTH